MYKILIVDDEVIVRHALKTLIKWDTGRFEFAGSAANGKSALKMVGAAQPDIIITDMKMPEMDGIELIKKLLEHGFDGEILVLSNYNDFELVREALKCGAHDYVLKLTLQADNFMLALEEIASKLDGKKRKKRDTESVKPTDYKKRVKAVLEMKYSPEVGKTYDSVNHGESLLFQKKEAIFLFVLRHLDKPEPNNQRRAAYEMLENLSGELFTGCAWSCVVPLASDRFLLAVSYNAAQVVQSEEIARRLASLTFMYHNVKFGVIYSEGALNCAELDEEVRKCREAEPLLFYRSLGEGCLSNSVQPKEFPLKFKACEKDQVDHPNHEKLSWLSSWQHSAKQLIADAACHHVHPKLLKRTLNGAIWNMIHNLALHERDTFDESLWMEEIAASSSDTELAGIVARIAEEASDQAGIFANIQVTKPEVRSALLYLDEHFAERIVISDIAERVNLSETYLCQIFKTETGRSILTYVNELRMKKAYELLASGKYLVKQAAAQVGIDDPFYFNRLFKKHFGISPKSVKQPDMPGSI
ncbi:response regulator [Paenibacillus puldeungensis]|uniref:Response regulator n=1 Tax=Paenibacillus puldeungensis TaxID=696536 RepID=A0ABW3RZ34_9BACL